MKSTDSSILTSPTLRVLTEHQLWTLHSAALEVLRRTGIRIFHRGALDLLHQANAFISDENLVRFPARMVDEALTSVPSRIVMCNRNGKPAMYLEGRNVYFGTGSDCVYLLDSEGERRKFTTHDLIDGYRLCDALPNIGFVMSIGIPGTIDPTIAYDTQMALMLEHTTKPIVFVADDRAGCRRAIDMAAAVAGGIDVLRERPNMLLYSEPSPPLRQSETAMDKLLLMAEYELPVVHSPASMMGGTAPITLAGGLVMSLAEILSGLVVHQLERPGAPFVFGAGLHHLDMKSMQIAHPSPEFELTKSAIVQLGQWYDIPTWGYAGNSDSKVMDEQSALESMFSVTLAQLNGANLVHDVGYMESGLATSFEMIVLTDELIAMTARFMQGFDICHETLLLDEIDSVGPGGNFLVTEQTLRRYREFWYPGLLDRNRYEQWSQMGSTTLGQRLRSRVREIIATHQPEPLDPRRIEMLHDILGKAE